MDDLKIAAVCMHSIPGAITRNIDRIDAMAQEASANGADVVCFPELSVTGYMQDSPGRIYGREEMEKIVGRLVRSAGEMRIVIMAGLIEVVDEGNPYITQIIAGPEGVIGSYRKTHLGPTETTLYRPGQKIEVYKAANTRFGVQLCYEAHFPEISTRMALMGADMVFLPHASPRGTPEEKLESWMRHLPARAFDNGLFVIACNQVGACGGGLTFPGVAVAFGPDGRVLARYVGMREHILYADLRDETLQEVRRHRMKYFLPGRRPSLYEKTSLNGNH
ncbi:MAG: Nitrilase [Thermodesulfobacteriota bacterium]|nr:Nitrilase [Thermodesulfobacteriota bacterium]